MSTAAIHYAERSGIKLASLLVEEGKSTTPNPNQGVLIARQVFRFESH